MQVGDYVRTIKGIGKIKKIEIDKKDVLIYLDSNITIDYIKKDFTDEEIIKMYPSSPNIIDLIEVGDYVNGYYVEDIRDVFDGEDTYTRISLASGCNYFQPDITDEKDIKSIVTKEQFKNMEYKIGE